MVHLKWNAERFTFDVPPPNTPLSVIRDSVAQFTSLPRDGFKLIHKGAVMRDDNAPISAYQIRQSSTIAVVEIGPPPEPQQAAPPIPPPRQKTAAPIRSEQTVVSTIQSEIGNVRQQLSPAVDHLLASAAGEREPKEHLRLSELLLQSLLRLDAIQTDGEWETARRERKAAVKEVQALLDRLDGGVSR
ncbi:Ubiquitin-like domain-containing protein [Mycena sanguinolenta]|uniref:Ubiquitin-like domain-containing protein n=1 Tax=Mycena sanguinolenta TaxID=230812 RepID=A0A8H6ZC88_9AGAR|nr:Ubiquitin-like domain-containing protein [Mycena sanguinolenta]